MTKREYVSYLMQMTPTPKTPILSIGVGLIPEEFDDASDVIDSYIELAATNKEYTL